MSTNDNSNTKQRVWTAEYVEYIQMIAQDVVSLNLPIKADGEIEDSEIGDLIPDVEPTPEEVATRNDRKRFLRLIMKKCLSPREENVIVMRYGLDDEPCMTLSEIGEQFGLSRERVRQLEARACRKLKAKFVKGNIRMEDL